jgi:hypothetical protein
MEYSFCSQEVGRALICVYVYKLIHDAGRLDDYKFYAPEYVDPEMDFESSIYGLDHVTEKVWSRVSRDEDYGTGIETMYFSDPVIMEYYRRCREYGARRRVKLADNPYMLEAEAFVRRSLDQGCPVCDYKLLTKINHEWASGILFRMWPEFEWHFALLININHVFKFYKEQLHRLKKELETPATENWKEAA